MDSEEELLTAYLLGELPEERQRAVEERMFTDDAYLERLELRENLLIEQYRRNELSAAKRARFQEHFLQSPRRQRQFQLATNLESYFAPSQAANPPKRAGWLAAFFQAPTVARWLVAGSLALAVFSIGLTFQANRQVAALNSLMQDLERQRRAAREKAVQLEAELRERNAKGAATAEASSGQAKSATEKAAIVLAIALPQGIFRGAEERVIHLPATVKTLRFTLPVDSVLKPGVYRAAIRTEGGVEVWNGEGQREAVRAGVQSLAILAPAEIFRPGRYFIAVSAANEPGVIADYSFRVQ